ncbi:two-component sensor histidine kinase, partial [Streptomyces sp. URMC 123]
MRSVRARAAVGATAVVAVALVAAGLALLAVLGANLRRQADLQAEVTAREVASQVATGVAYDRLDLPDAEDHPVRVVDERGTVRAADRELQAVTGAPAPSSATSSTARSPSRRPETVTREA